MEMTAPCRSHRRAESRSASLMANGHGDSEPERQEVIGSEGNIWSEMRPVTSRNHNLHTLMSSLTCYSLLDDCQQCV